MSGGLDRTYRARLPAGYDGSPRPLVIVLHGGFGSGQQIEMGSGMNPIADREGFVVAYPDGFVATTPIGAVSSWNGGECCGPAQTQGVDDVGFLTAVVDRLEADACIDTDRVYFTGMSNGGIMSYRMACERAERIAAFAPVAGTNSFPACAPARPVALFHVHGTADANVPYEGGTGCGAGMVQTAPIVDVVASWATTNGCTGASSVVFQEGDGTCVSSGTCAADTVLCSIANGNHSWPGGGGINPGGCGQGIVSTTFHASEAIWTFFAGQRLEP